MLVFVMDEHGVLDIIFWKFMEVKLSRIWINVCNWMEVGPVEC